MPNLENKRCSGPPNQEGPVNATASANDKNPLETDKSTEKCESFQKVIAPLGLSSGNERRILDELSASSAAAKPESLLKAVQDPTSSKKAVTDPETQGCVIKFDQYRGRSSRAVPDAKPQGDGHINNNTGLPLVPPQNTYEGEEVLKIMKVKVKKISSGHEPYEAVVAGKIDSIHIDEFKELDENPFAPVDLEKLYRLTRNPGNNNNQRKQSLGKLALWRRARLEIETLIMANDEDEEIASVKRLSTNLLLKDVMRSTYRVEYRLEYHKVQGRGLLLKQAKALIEKKIMKINVKLIKYSIPPKDNDSTSSSGSSFEDDSFPEGEAPDWAKSKGIGTSKTNTPKDDEHNHIPMALKPDKENTTSAKTEVIEKETELNNSVGSDKFQGDPTSSKKSETKPKICRCEPRIKK